MMRLGAATALAALAVLAGVPPDAAPAPRAGAAGAPDAAYRSSRSLCARAGAAMLWARYGPDGSPSLAPSRAGAIEAYAASRYGRGSEAFAEAVRGCSETLHE